MRRRVLHSEWLFQRLFIRSTTMCDLHLGIHILVNKSHQTSIIRSLQAVVGTSWSIPKSAACSLWGSGPPGWASAGTLSRMNIRGSIISAHLFSECLPQTLYVITCLMVISFILRLLSLKIFDLLFSIKFLLLKIFNSLLNSSSRWSIIFELLKEPFQRSWLL